MPDDNLKNLRRIRNKAKRLLDHVASDLGAFYKEDTGTYYRTPLVEHKANDISVTCTCSCWMSLALTGNEPGGGTHSLTDIVRRVVAAPWESSGLDENNSFTTTLVIRSLGYLLKHGLLKDSESTSWPEALTKAWGVKKVPIEAWGVKEIPPKERTIIEIVRQLSQEPKRLAIGEYPPSAAVVYWFVDGVINAGIELLKTDWERICDWAGGEFRNQLSLVVSGHAAMMDPVAMAMSACLCARLEGSARTGVSGFPGEKLHSLPTRQELVCAVSKLLAVQTQSGIWNKYFPLFHYKDAGSNFCFTFELLEAVIHEFGADSYSLYQSGDFLTGLERAVDWCEANRLNYRGVDRAKTEEEKLYEGWNSGGQMATLRQGAPESWATAVVHMFLHEAVQACSHWIQRELLLKYKARPPEDLNKKGLDQLLDVQVLIGNEENTLTGILRKEFVDGKVPKGIRGGSAEQELRSKSLEDSQRRSALLFGPPGCSKTKTVQALATELQWQLIEITPSDFVRDTLANVYARADEIFEDMLDLAGVVVFFDEMEALVPTRDSAAPPDLTSQFLTTTMLPKLADLHGRGHVLFFMATNHQERFDAAIKRPGRFDLLLCMGPPTVEAKLARLPDVYEPNTDTGNAPDIAKKIREFLKTNAKARSQFQLLTYGESKQFLKDVAPDCVLKPEYSNAKGFCDKLLEYGNNAILKISDLDKAFPRKKLEDLLKNGKLVEAHVGKEGDVPAVVRYLSDWHQSKRQ